MKSMVLRYVAEAAFEGTLAESILDIPKKIIPGTKPTMRCCVYKERAILAERVKLAMGGDRANPNIIEVISIACDECVKGGYQVTDNCRGCIAHRCEAACPAKAISFNEKQHAQIDIGKCLQCGKCSQVCPYGAIVNYRRPCENACKTGAIGMDSDGAATINYENCTSCGACVYQCPFGAIMDKSFILDTVNLLKEAAADPEARLVAIVAPSVAVQYKNANPGQVAAALLKLGFTDVVEAALGADMTSANEAPELAGKGSLFSSCCPAFVSLVKKKFPNLAEFISETPSPMAMAAMNVKLQLPGAKTVFIGPCTAKKAEVLLERVRPFVDNAITFEEMDALFEARNISPAECVPELYDDATSYGRNFAQTGGVVSAVTKALREQNEGIDDYFDVRPVVCSGSEECMKALKKVAYGRPEGNFIEGMACAGGCVNGPASLRHPGNEAFVILSKHAEEVRGKRITDTANGGAKLS
ncbi:MAG: 4Fe-4S dicluster domain-containing protein [Clostridia bacterium]|nr:4Fe-4S dicluster domain-containing protein [Clostridia bacterium]